MRIASMFISVILLLSLMGIVLGCSSDNDETETSVNQSDAEMIKIMNYVPENVDSFIFGDIAAMRTEENLGALQEIMTMSYLGVLNPMDINLDQVNCFAGVSDADYEGEVVIIKGNIELDAVKQALERYDAYVEEYRQIEVWEIDSSGWSYYDTSLLTFIDDMLVVGTDDAIRLQV